MIEPVVLQAEAAENAIVNNIIRFVPRAIWAFVVLAVGILAAGWVADRAEDAVYDSHVVANWLAEPAETATKVLVSYFAVTIALAELGVSTSVLVVFLDGIAFGIGAGAALVVGISLGWGSSDFVSERVEDWLDAVKADTVERPAGTQQGGQHGGHQGGQSGGQGGQQGGHGGQQGGQGGQSGGQGGQSGGQGDQSGGQQGGQSGGQNQ